MLTDNAERRSNLSLASGTRPSSKSPGFDHSTFHPPDGMHNILLDTAAALAGWSLPELLTHSEGCRGANAPHRVQFFEDAPHQVIYPPSTGRVPMNTVKLPRESFERQCNNQRVSGTIIPSRVTCSWRYT